MRTAFFVPIAALFVFGGTVSTISSKWADLLVIPTPSNPDATFIHPFMQTWIMFLGEFSCMLAFNAWLCWRKVKKQEVKPGVHHALPVLPLIYLAPAMCDFTASTTMFIGLTLTQASVYQMLRGATVLFTAIFSRVLLKRKFQIYQWVGMLLVIAGLLCVGATSFMNKSGGDSSSGKAMIGNALILAAQLIASLQMVIEERIMSKYQTHPMELVGWEGFFGLSVTTVVVIVFQAFPSRPDNIVEFFYQMSVSGEAQLSTLLLLGSIPLLNACGQTITKNISAATRMVMDTIRNVFVWIFTLIFASYFGETFQWLQLIGFLLLVGGNCIYKHLIKVPVKFMQHVEPEVEPDVMANNERSGLVSDTKSDTTANKLGAEDSSA